VRRTESPDSVLLLSGLQPLKIDQMMIKDIKVLETIKEGTTIYQTH
jgi:predicted amidohydrolase YtcJ